MPAPVPTSTAPSGPRAVPANRRQRLRLRDLCDEVIASHRAARGADVISEPERQDARTLLAGLAPTRG